MGHRDAVHRRRSGAGNHHRKDVIAMSNTDKTVGTRFIASAAVLGAGVMGAAIAAHLANVGIPSLLLDIVPPNAGKDRNVVARTGLEKTLKARPAAFYSPKAARLITVGNIEDDLHKLGEVDWVIEAVIERLDIKQALYEKLEKVIRPGAIITSNTSGLPAHLLTEGRS